MKLIGLKKFCFENPPLPLEKILDLPLSHRVRIAKEGFDCEDNCVLRLLRTLKFLMGALN